MTLAIGLIVVFVFFVWLVFFKFKWLKWSIPWAIVSLFVVVHALFIFYIGLRFVTPCSVQATVIQHTIQLTPRLSEPTLVTAVLVEPNVPVKKQFTLRNRFSKRVNRLRWLRLLMMKLFLKLSAPRCKVNHLLAE